MGTTIFGDHAQRVIDQLDRCVAQQALYGWGPIRLARIRSSHGLRIPRAHKKLPFESRAPEGEMEAPPDVLSVHTDLGQSYLAAMRLEVAQRELRELGIELRGAAADEAPGAYKRLGEVLAAHEGTVEILHELRPLGVAMAGPETLDPWKD